MSYEFSYDLIFSNPPTLPPFVNPPPCKQVLVKKMTFLAVSVHIITRIPTSIDFSRPPSLPPFVNPPPWTASFSEKMTFLAVSVHIIARIPTSIVCQACKITKSIHKR